MRVRHPLLVVGGFLVVGTVVLWFVFIALVTGVEQAPPTDCATFDPQPGQWQSTDYFGRYDIYTGLDDCDTFANAGKAEVQALLGPPDGQGRDRFGTVRDVLQYRNPYNDGAVGQGILEIFFAGGRVTEMSYDSGGD